MPTKLEEVPIGAQPIERFLPLVGEERMQLGREIAAKAGRQLQGRVFWNVNSTSRGGGVAELLRAILPYARGAGVDARWLVIEGTPEFFQITKRLHHALHGSQGDGSELGERQREVYDRVLRDNSEELLGLVNEGDVVLLHDPQTTGLLPHLANSGAALVWRCHVGGTQPNEEVARGWDFLEPYLVHAQQTIFSRSQYVPHCCDHEKSIIIPPSIDVFSPKNQELDEATTRSILVHTGLVEGPPGDGTPGFHREDGSPARVDRHADVVRMGRAPSWEAPLVVQVSRWDELKDPLGVMKGFATLIDGEAPGGAELVLAGPNVRSVADDPEQVMVYEQVEAAWRKLPHAHRNRVHLACLPMTDVEENAAIVNALQRHAAVVVQKSLHEGFGLTVTEAMWKGRPVVASRVGGIQDQIEDGVNGLLLEDPSDLEAFAEALRTVLEDAALAERLGANAQERVRQSYLGMRHLLQYAELVDRLTGAAQGR
jgi:trehalose synthase